MKKVTQLMRTLTQAAVFLWLSMISLTHMYGRFGFGWPGNSAASLDQYCPFGALETLPTLIGGLKDGTFKFIGGTGFNDFLILAVLLIITILFSGAFCGYLCPFGAVFDWLYWLRKKIFRKDVRINAKLSSVLAYTRYLVFAFLLIQTTRLGYLMFAEFDPYRAFFHFGHELTLLMGGILLLVIVGSLVIERFACNYICPLGGFVGLVSLAGMTKIVKTREKGHACNDCGMCDRACPVNLTPSKTIEAHRCIMCAKCVDACVAKNTLVFSFAGKEWK